MSAIIVLTMGPVQSYISQARRTQDLWQGSRILSYLAGVGVYKAHEKAGWKNTIYPQLPELLPGERRKTDPYASIPNRIVVQWEGDEAGARECARGMQNAIEAAWEKLSQNTLRYFLNGTASKRVEDIWERQQKSWLECYWVVVPYDASQSYAYNINAANSAMSARKLLRNFPQIHENGRKCSITGEHEALHDMEDYVAFWNARKAEQRNLALLGKHERLSAISTIKRFAHEEAANNHDLRFPNRLPSTSSIAAAPFKYEVLQKVFDDSQASSARDSLKAFIERLLILFEDPTINDRAERRRKAERLLFFTRQNELNPEHFSYIREKLGDSVMNSDLTQQFLSIDGDFLFEDTLIVKTIEEYLPPVKVENEESREKAEAEQRRRLKPLVVVAQKALQTLLGVASDLGIPKPQPYLVILSMDGDNMGKTLGKLAGVNQHNTFSKTLADFARQNVRRIVEEEHLGRVVYAGGDDVLALLPVRDALQVAEKLRSEFEETVALIGVRNHEGKPVTASTGLAYVHHTHNLQDAVRAAKDAQKIAKNRYKRNAVAVEFLRRSGEPRSMGHKWQINDPKCTLDHMKSLITAFRNELSRNLPYDMAQIGYSMADSMVPDAALQAELSRILNRRLNIKEDEEKKAAAKRLLKDILALIDAPSGTLDQRWQNAQCWLELARFVAQEEGDL